MAGTILIVAPEADAHSRHVAVAAQARGMDVAYFDASQYPIDGVVALRIPRTASGAIHASLDTRQRRIALDDITGVWWRRPHGLVKRQRGSPLDTYIALESEVVVRSLSDFIPRRNWVSDPEATRTATRKPPQLKAAREIGFAIPDTCITNSPAEAEAFLSQLGERKLVLKPVGTAFIQLAPDESPNSPNNRVVFTRTIEHDLFLSHINMVRNCPVILQEAINKEVDVRVTVVDDRAFAAAIHLDGCDDSTNLDWRNHGGTRRYSAHALPTETKDMCIEITHKLGLRFGCLDLGFSEADGYTFFEINPQGQWLPSELNLGYPIASALLDALTRDVDRGLPLGADIATTEAMA